MSRFAAPSSSSMKASALRSASSEIGGAGEAGVDRRSIRLRALLLRRLAVRPPCPLRVALLPAPSQADGSTACGRRDANVIVLARQNVPRAMPGSSSTKVEGAERRQALGCLRGTRSERARDARPARPRADQLSQSARRGTLASRRSTAAVFWPRARQDKTFGRWPDAAGVRWLRRVHSHDPLVVAEGGVLRHLPGARLRAVHAGRRIPLRLWLVSGDALGERDGEEG